MSRMKIGSKLLLTYFILIISLFVITSLSFHFISQRYLIKETEQQLDKEARVMSQLLSRVALSSEMVQEKLGNRKALVVSKKLLSSKMIIWSEQREIVYTDLNDASLQQFLKEDRETGRRFISETVAITSKNGTTKGYVTLITRLDEIKEINRLMRKSQLVSFVISVVIAVCLALFFEKNLTRPIQKLANHMKNYSLQRGSGEILIETKDEMKELADSFNALSRKLKQYDADQKQFFQNASHELKTPLMAIQGNAEGILDGVVEGEDVGHSLQVIISESQRLKRIVEGITYLARLESGKVDYFVFKEESVEAMILGAVQSVTALADQRGIDVVVESKFGDSVIMDGEKMKRALINLLGNAIRYAESRIVVRSFVAEQQVVVEVKDDGVGLEPGEEEKIFQRFYSGDAGGSGIGLAIVKAIIEGHKGSIHAFNEKPKGAVFQVKIPLLLLSKKGSDPKV
ncbi:HAMP domain-containing sensor histidine kinase [Bacillus salipaludis]|uniref:sensor histidine kinase n=1 Tax=Bacillus salipaludis TaxID=2547811 RepID=UPI002E214800|nr:HAMP domain-containing sensor histidine kinase [Bacillus salipaludis]